MHELPGINFDAPASRSALSITAEDPATPSEPIHQPAKQIDIQIQPKNGLPTNELTTRAIRVWDQDAQVPDGTIFSKIIFVQLDNSVPVKPLE